jgi:SAM-dependent methyltransferase
MPDAELPPPAVSPDLYDSRYYLESCLGHAEWSRSGGREVAGLYAGVLDLAGLRPGEVLVDLGTGRGELLAVAVERGAGRAVGVEYSPSAVELAKRTLRAHDVEDRATALLGDARATPIDGGSADLVTLIDVVEHLAPDELDRTLREALRILRPGGRLLAHTMPNRSIYEVTYRLQRALRPRRRRDWPADPRNEYERLMHVNEQTVRSLRRALRRAGFRPASARVGAWVYTDFVPQERGKRLYRALARFPPTARLGVGDIWADGRKPPAVTRSTGGT